METCPEQYDVYFGDFQIGYLRLRHGSFSASYPDYTGETVFHAYQKAMECLKMMSVCRT